MYIRFVRPNIVDGMHARKGLFSAAYELYRVGETDENTRRLIWKYLNWYGNFLPVPSRFSRSTSKATKYQTRGLSWFKPNAIEHIDNAQKLASVLNKNGYPVETIRSARVGYILYEDRYQVVADPFKDTPT